MPSASQKLNPAAYYRSIRFYREGTDAAKCIKNFLLSKLTKVEGARDPLFNYNVAGITGYLAPRVDANGLIGFAFYQKRKPSSSQKLTFRRDKQKYPYAQTPLFLTAPNVWAHLNGYTGQTLVNEDYRKWKDDLEEACGVNACANDSNWNEKFELPFLPNPDCIEPPNSTIRNQEDAVWKGCERHLGRRLFLKRRRLIYLVLQFFSERWRVSANTPSNWTGKVIGWPKALKCSNGYVALSLNISLKQARATISDLEALGYIQAVYYAPSGIPNKRGIYYYFPGFEVPPKQSTKHPSITPRGALDWMRKKPAWIIAEQAEIQRAAYFDALEEKIEREHNFRRASLKTIL